MLSSADQGQIPLSLGPLGDLLKALMFLSNLNGFNSSPSPPEQRFNSRKGSSSKTKVQKEKGSKWFNHFFSLSLYVFALLVCFAFLFVSQSSFMLYVFLYVFVWLFSVFVLFCFSQKKKWKIRKNTKTVCLCILVLVYPRWPLKQSFLNFVSLVVKMSISMHN